MYRCIEIHVNLKEVRVLENMSLLEDLCEFYSISASVLKCNLNIICAISDLALCIRLDIHKAVLFIIVYAIY